MEDEQPGRFESYVDRIVREAIERGEFDHNPLSGKPVHLGRPGAEKPWILSRLEREDLGDTLPAPLQVRRAKERIAQSLAGVRDEQQAREIVVALNEAIKASNLDAGAHPRVITSLLDVEATVAAWRASRADGGAAPQ
ncbi:protein of unknown function [Propionibacterium cyclohexanicum]|uniref:DnaJ homologue subfamily C member 28 conserved domain-containing protein n=1 Tax=Propionibacterium cyclohexanicum TaxID=64702 RepID=A0A1H9T726_9ACTN|nr:DnaJ family domain-containing protein [Propionibacterium cyclohexanicum]SER93060.1 protein of unknown function [Propionibacterium cyclohexanicum]